MISQAIEEYYQRLCNEWKANNESLPKVPFNNKTNKELYQGNEDDEGYVEWKIIKVKNSIPINSLDGNLGIVLHKDLYELFNSYYFLELGGFIDENEVVIHNLTPDTKYEIFIKRRFENLEINLIRVRYIQIGDYVTPENSFLLCFDNDTGELIYYDPENLRISNVSESLEKLIRMMTPRY